MLPDTAERYMSSILFDDIESEMTIEELIFTLFNFLAGIPATVTFEGAFFKTKLPAATLEFLPIVMFPELYLMHK